MGNLTEREIYFARDVAKLVRMAAYTAITTSGWGTLLIVETDSLDPSEVQETVRCTMGPIPRRNPSLELVRVNFNSARRTPIPDYLIDVILDEISPFIIGVGNVIAEHHSESFIVFRTNEREEDFGHDSAPEIEVTPEMLKAGLEEWCLFDSDDRAEWIIPAIYAAMAKADPSRHIELHTNPSRVA